MRRLRILLLVAVAALPVLLVMGADLVLVPAAEDRVESRARSTTKSASVEAEIGSFPVAARALALGEVAMIDITWFGVEVGSLQATSLELDLKGVGLDRSRLLRGEIQINGVESGDVRLLIAPSQLSRLFGTEVRIRGGEVRVRTTSDTEVAVEVSATNRGLVLAAPGVGPVTAELGSAQIPCAPTTSVAGDNLVLSCSFRGLPPILRDE